MKMKQNPQQPHPPWKLKLQKRLSLIPPLAVSLLLSTEVFMVAAAQFYIRLANAFKPDSVGAKNTLIVYRGKAPRKKKRVETLILYKQRFKAALSIMKFLTPNVGNTFEKMYRGGTPEAINSMPRP
jgi:hypothetical protein